MKILLVDNGTIHLEKIKKAFAGHEVEVQRYSPRLIFNSTGQDLIVLTGGGAEGQEINDKVTANQFWYQNEMNFVRTCHRPILGICMGFEVIAKAFGATIENVNCYFEDFKPFKATAEGKKLFGRSDLSQYEAHHMGAKQVPSDFDVLAESPACVEVIRHKTRPIIATQFHPEVPGGSLTLKNLVSIIA
jgi:GMP synthase-like glutamine amidotransferase